ncbi:MAG: TetR/AcrR family transcriptional regulator [Labrys sp. (in: a-proteobacteria)]|jgi:AcrR family transcriptional regulator
MSAPPSPQEANAVEARRTKAGMTEATRRLLLETARIAFGAKGYSDVALEDLVRDAGVTRGALYHHFGSKQGLFEALVGALDAEITASIHEATSGVGDPWQQFVLGCRRYLEIVTHDAGLRRIMLRDSPAVLGYEAFRALDNETAIVPIRDAILDLSARGLIRPLPAEALAHLINGALCDAALWIGDSADPAAALAQATAAFEAMLAGLRAP